MSFHIVHSIVLVDDQICAADRENGRIQCFDKGGRLIRIIEHRDVMGENVYAIAYSHGEIVVKVLNGKRGITRLWFQEDYCLR